MPAVNPFANQWHGHECSDDGLQGSDQGADPGRQSMCHRPIDAGQIGRMQEEAHRRGVEPFSRRKSLFTKQFHQQPHAKRG